MTRRTPTRRDTLLWLTAAAAASGCGDETGNPSALQQGAAKARYSLKPAAHPSGPSYGYDPDRMTPATPWPLTMSSQQLALTARLSAVIIPADDGGPSAEDLGAHHYVNEWVSAPYPEQKQDRADILRLLDIIETDCRNRFGVSSADASPASLSKVLDEFAWLDRVAVGREEDAAAFVRLRRIVIGAYAMSEQGRADIGYVGNIPIGGAYPGPTDEALAHLNAALKEVGLEL